MGSKYSPYPGDVVDAKLEPGEYVLNRNAVDAIGKETLDELNFEEEPRFKEGGKVTQSIGVVNEHKTMLGKLKKIKLDKQLRKFLKHRVPADSYNDHIKLREKNGSLMTIEEQQKVLDYFARQRSKPGMNEGGAIFNKLQSDRQFNKEQYENPSIMFKDNSLMARLSRREEADDVALRQATNARISQYHKEVKDLEQQAKLRELQRRAALQGAPALDIRKQDYSVNLQDIKPIDYDGPEFSADEFNSLLGAKKTLHKFAESQDLLDSSGRNPFFDKDYGSPRGISYKDFVPPKNRKLTEAEQLAMTMKNSQDEKFNTLLDDSSPAVKRVLEDNPMLKMEHMRRKDARLAIAEEARQKVKRGVELEYSPYALHNADIRAELIGDPNDPDDDYGSSFADAQKRSDERSLLASQQHEIAMMNPGGAPKYVVEDRNKKGSFKSLDRPEWLEHQAEGGRLHNKRMSEERHSNVIKERALRKNAMSKDPKLRKEYQDVNRELKAGNKGLRLGSKKDYKSVTKKLKEHSAKKVSVPSLPEGKKSMYREFIKGADEGRHRRSRDILNKYVYQRGGNVRYYNTGDFVGPRLPQAPKLSLRRNDSMMDIAPVDTSSLKMNNVKQGLDDVGSRMMSQAELGLRGGSRAIASAAKNRYGKGFTSGKNQAMEEIASKMQWGDKDWNDMSREEQISASKQIKETGVGMDKYQKARMYGRGITQAANQTGKDLITAGKGAVGAVGVGAAGLYKGAGMAKDKLVEGYGKAKDWMMDDEGHADMMDVMAGKAKGSNRQRVGKGISFLGTGLRQLSTMHGYDGGDGFNQWKQTDEDPGTLLDEGQEETTESSDEVKDNVTLESIGVSTPKPPRPEPEELTSYQESYEEADPYGEDKGYLDLYGYQEGGQVPMESFIRHSWRNMQWK